MIYRCTNAYYFGYINKIGGIESHLYYIAKKYSNYDITIFYRNGDNTQLNRLKKYVRCVKITDSDKVICEKMFCCFNREILKQCDAKEKILVLHGDYKDMVERKQLDYHNLPKDERIDRYIGVSQLVCDAWEEVTGIKAKNVYEPIVLNKVKKLLSKEKVSLSVTVRLHQLRTTPPPADRGVLMVYNTGSIMNPHTENSILSLPLL